MVDCERRGPCVRVVAVFAHVAGLDVRGSFAGCLSTVVAVDAIAGDVDVIKICRKPCRGRMTVVAGNSAVDMCRVLAGRGYTVMTGATGPEDLRVIYCQ